MHLDLATILILHPLSLTVGAICFLYLRFRSRRSPGLGKMAVAFLVLAMGSVAAGAGEEGLVDYETWTYWSFVSGPLAYTLFFIGLRILLTERPAGRSAWLFVVPAGLAVAAYVTGFHLVNAYRASVFLWSMALYAIGSAVLALSDPQREGLGSRYGLAGALCFKALIGFATFAAVSYPDWISVTPPTTFLVLILCQFAIAMFVLILVQERSEQRLIALTETDSLTRIRNRHWLMDRLPVQAPKGSGFVVIDLDHFKRVNDQYGHLVGDLVLKRAAQAMALRLGEGAYFARTGGEEFGLYLPRTSAAEMLAIGEALRQEVEGLGIVYEGVTIPVTLSAGGSMADEVMSTKRLAARADHALYVAKREGRNCVRLYGAPETADEALPDGPPVAAGGA
jgi:diguanylate cyclase (GGDEF)-like protein